MGSVFVDDPTDSEDVVAGMALADSGQSDDTTPSDSAVTASEALANPWLAIATSSARAAMESPSVDLESMVLSSGELHDDVLNSVLDAEIERTIDGASTFTLTLFDPDGDYRKSQLFKGQVDCTIDGHDYRLANIRKQDVQLILTFETLGIALLRQKKGFKRAWRRTHMGGKGLTRAEFVLSLVREIKHPFIPVTIPFLHEIRPVGAIPRKTTVKKKSEARDPGLGSHLTIKGAKATDAQLHNLEIALTEANKLKAQRKAILAMLCSGIGESAWRDVMNGNQVSVEVYKSQGGDAHPGTSGYGGVLQGDVAVKGHVGHFYNMDPDERTQKEAYWFMKGGEGYQGGGAIYLVKKEKTWDPGQIADRIESGGAGGAFYQQHIEEAKAILKDWGEGKPGSTITYTRIKKFAFRRGTNEDSWTAILRLSQEDVEGEPLGWRAFFIGNRFYWISEQQLFKSRSVASITEGENDVDVIDFEFDRGHPVATCDVTCRASAWIAPPGSVVTVFGMDERVDGKWLVDTIRRKRFDLNTSITLRKPQAEEAEPAPDVEQETSSIPGATSSKKAAKGGIYTTKNFVATGKRIDQGIDFAGRGNVPALADGVITRAKSSGTGWPGGTMIVQKLDHPVKMGGRTYRYIYYAENIAVKCKEGQRVSAGDILGFARGVYPFTETGWASDANGTTYARSVGEADRHPNHSNTPAGIDFANWMGFGPASTSHDKNRHHL